MSIAERIDDVFALMKLGRWQGALLNVLIAIAASSRKRYPQQKGYGKNCPGCLERDRRAAAWKRECSLASTKGLPAPKKPVCSRAYQMAAGTPSCDHHAFETFFDEEFWKKTSIAIRGPEGVMQVSLGNEAHSFEHIIYSFFRCELAHEGKLPVMVAFEGDALDSQLFVHGGGPGMPFVLSRSHLNVFTRVVVEAPENKDEFRDSGGHPAAAG